MNFIAVLHYLGNPSTQLCLINWHFYLIRLQLLFTTYWSLNLYHDTSDWIKQSLAQLWYVTGRVSGVRP